MSLIWSLLAGVWGQNGEQLPAVLEVAGPEPLACVTLAFSTKRQIFDAVRQLLRLTDFGDQLKIADTCANGDLQLVAIDDATETNSFKLATSGFRQKIIVLGEEDSLKMRGSSEQLRIGQLVRAILERRHDVDTASSQALRDGPPDVLIHQVANRHQSTPRSRSRATNRDGPASRRHRSTRSCRRSMSVSISSL